MAKVNSEIMKALRDKLDVSRRTVYRRIKDVRKEFNYTVDKQTAANVLAARNSIDIGNILEQDELADVQRLEVGTPQPKTIVKKEENSSNNTSSSNGTLPKRFMDRELYKRCDPQFENGSYQSAVRDGFLVLEERIREKGGFKPSDHGVDLVTDAFHYDSGPLSFGATESERQGVMNLYRSAFQTFRNPSSHRILDNMDEKQAYNILFFVNSLLTMIKRN